LSYLDDPEHWRDRARQTRAMAETVTDSATKRAMLGFPWEAATPFRHPQGGAGTSAQSYFGSLMSQFARGILPGWEIARLHEQSARLCGRDPERQLLGSCEFKNLVLADLQHAAKVRRE
jgi:hypothetical protein